MKRTHLPLNALRVFDAAARHLSFTRAADELAVTPAAVGQQIRALEDVLGVVLFAVALFFAGMSTKLQTPVLRRTLLVLGSLLFAGTAAWIGTFPVSVSI